MVFVILIKVMKRYNPSEIEPKWQSIWEEQKVNQVQMDKTKQKIYVSGMFPYPSGAGLHAGHFFSYSIVDAIARFHRQHGRNVLNPMGWDTFGLPAENYAIKTGMAPSVATATNIENFKKQFKRMGVSIDWSREVNTSDPEYYRWTQWIFTKFFERGLAYQKESMQWWCPIDKTVLANEQVEAGKCWRCGNEVEKKSMKQWFFKITDYADSLLDEIEDLDWPTKIKTAQTNWIGKSQGAEVQFKIDEFEDYLTVFTTRPDTLFGATFLVVAPEHPMLGKIMTDECRAVVEEYVKISTKKSEIERMNDSREKTGVFTGRFAVNPASGEKVQIWVADYVLSGYGTGAIMAVPAHDERDFAFAEKFKLPIIEVLEKPAEYDEEAVYHGEGIMINSSVFNGKNSSDVREEIVAWLEHEGTGKSQTTYKMRDWLISRQRYWGAPIPVIHCEDHGAVAVPETDLPVVLPEIADYAPRGNGKSVLGSVDSWVNAPCPTCGKPGKRETDTLDGYACSSWYLLRYTDPNNTEQAWDPEAANYWAPVDYYIGGDHAVAHLLYVRFWSHVFKDMGLTIFKEPIKKLIYHGYINAEDGTKMSKSKGNVVDPIDVIDQGYGADTLRTYVLFMGPVELDAVWDSKGIAGVYRFLNRVWVLAQEYLESDKAFNGNDEAVRRIQHKTVRRVTDDINRQSFNTAISGLMEYTNELYKLKVDGFSDEAWRDALMTMAQLIAPFAPHISEELNSILGSDKLVQNTSWPTWDASLIVDEKMTIIVQVNGKLRAKLEVAKGTSDEDVKKQAVEAENVVNFVGNKKPTKIIYVPGRLVSIVV